MDLFDFLALQGILKSLSLAPQFESIDSSVLSFFLVQLLQPYMTTGKTVGLSIWIFVGKVMSVF